jgi:hypothetical protein
MDATKLVHHRQLKLLCLTLLSSPQLSCAAHLRIIILVSSALLFSPGACLCCHTSLEQKYKHDDDSHSRNSSIYHNRAKAKLTATAYRFLLGVQQK